MDEWTKLSLLFEKTLFFLPEKSNKEIIYNELTVQVSFAITFN